VQEKLLDFADEKQARITLHLPAIHCVACVWLLENLFRLRAGIGESRVNFTRRETSITFRPTQIKLSEVAALLASLGYEPELTLGELGRDANKGPAGRHCRQRQWLQLGLAGFAFGNVMLLALPGYLGLDSLSGPWFKSLAGWLSLALALPVLIYSAADYWTTAWFAFKQRIVTLDIPIALGLAAIYGRSVFEVAVGREGYSDSLTALIFFLLCGRIFQRKTFDRLAFDRDYRGFFPLSVVRKTQEDEKAVAISELAVGDRLILRHGELVPADSRLVTGDAIIDYSFVTGESEPVTRLAGEHLYAGGRQLGGAIEVETLKPVSESYLTSLWNNEAFQKHRDSDSDSLTNRYSRRFTLMVLSVAVAAALIWLWVEPGVAMKAFTSVLIVACPCALALAAPLTLGTAQRLLARRQVFLRNAQVTERVAEIDTIVFDKTGTLTTGGGGAGGVQWQGAPLSDTEESWLFSMARHSAHPLAKRINEAMSRRQAVPVHSFVEIPGSGMNARIAGRKILMGSARWLTSLGILGLPQFGWPPALAESNGGSSTAAALPGTPPPSATSDPNGNTVCVAIDGRYRGRFGLTSELRPEIESLIERVRDRFSLVLLSGDHAREMERFRNLLGPKAHVHFNQNPFEKLNAIRRMQMAGHKIMMVGDGLNDAGALQQADVGVAVVENVGSFSPASDVIVDAAQLRRLPEVLTFSRRASRIMRVGFVLSAIYNVVGISIAASGLLSPIICAVLMPLSSVTVVLFAIGATRLMAERTFDRQSYLTKKAEGSVASGTLAMTMIPRKGGAL
jgi:Cu+-exporting ATPase